MQEKIVRCPGCNAVLRVKNSKGEEEKIITCPGCRVRLKVRFPKEQEPLTAITVEAPPKRQSGDTIIARPAMPGTPPPVSCRPALLLGTQRFPLSTGRHIIGRQAHASEADIQLPTQDTYMSRQHITITITPLADGRVQAMLSNYKNMNPTTVNDERLEQGDEIVLQSGYRIRMGDTTVEYTE